jgi:hypothetical protein
VKFVERRHIERQKLGGGMGKTDQVYISIALNSLHPEHLRFFISGSLLGTISHGYQEAIKNTL